MRMDICHSNDKDKVLEYYGVFKGVNGTKIPCEAYTELLANIIEETVKKISVPKRMRWNQSTAEFIRPIRWLLVIFGSETFATELFGVKVSNVTRGHRFHTAK